MALTGSACAAPAAPVAPVATTAPTAAIAQAFSPAVQALIQGAQHETVLKGSWSPTSFGGHLTHTDGLYFTTTVFSTVGFGDITAKTETARLVVTGQMITDLIIYGLAIKVFVRAVRRGQQRKAGPDGLRSEGDE